MRKFSQIFLIALLLLGVLPSCSRPMQAVSPPDVPSTPAETEQPEESSPPEVSGEGDTLEPEEARIAAYRAALEGLYFDHILPDGYEMDRFGEERDITQNRFAVYDVDLDGQDELILEYTTTIVAGKIAWIYDFDSASNSLREQLCAYPIRLTFFDNGAVEEGWSHNQGHGGRFWPYTLYQYDPETDTYREVGSADAWDTELFPERYPEGVEPDAGGFIYFLDMEYDMPVDGEAYTQWRNLYVGDAQILDVPYVNLTQENIAALEYTAERNQE